MGPMVSLCPLFFVLSSWVLLFVGHPPPSSTPLIEDFSLSLSLSLSPVITASLLDPTALVRSIVSSFILCFFVNTTLCLVSQEMEGKKNQNWKLRY